MVVILPPLKSVQNLDRRRLKFQFKKYGKTRGDGWGGWVSLEKRMPLSKGPTTIFDGAPPANHSLFGGGTSQSKRHYCTECPVYPVQKKSIAQHGKFVTLNRIYWTL
mgnify:CR=1 FL=1